MANKITFTHGTFTKDDELNDLYTLILFNGDTQVYTATLQYNDILQMCQKHGGKITRSTSIINP